MYWSNSVKKMNKKMNLKLKFFFAINDMINDNNEDVEFYFVKQNSKNKLDFII